MTSVLSVQDLTVNYGPARALTSISVNVEDGGTLAVLGPNGAGKTTLAKTITGLVRPVSGRVTFDGVDITGWPPYRIARLGIVHIPEGRGICPGLSVNDNLRIALRHLVKDRQDAQRALKAAYDYFPLLATRRKQAAGTLSGGEQQMLALARALATRPKLVVADEMSLGLAPLIVDNLFSRLRELHDQGIAIVLIEQFVDRAIDLSTSVVILKRGEQVWDGLSSEARAAAMAQYLGADETAREPEHSGPATTERIANS